MFAVTKHYQVNIGKIADDRRRLILDLSKSEDQPSR